MKKKREARLDFEIDSLTNSIRNTISGDSFDTEVTRLTTADLKKINKKNGWYFNWKSEFRDLKKEVYKLTIVNNPTIVQGLISFTVSEDHIFMDLLENAPFNLGKNKLYEGVAGNLVAYACKVAFQKGFDGYVSFFAKTNLVQHYIETLSAQQIGRQMMVINSEASKILVDRYFKN